MKGCWCEGLGRPVCGSSGLLPHPTTPCLRGEFEAWEDISRLQGLSPGGHRLHLEAIAEPVSMDRLRELVEISKPLAPKAAGPAGVTVDEPLLVLPWGSSVAVRPDYVVDVLAESGRVLRGRRVPQEATRELTARNDNVTLGLPGLQHAVVEGFKIGDIIPHLWHF